MPVRGGRISRLFQLIALLKGPTSWNGRRLAEHFGSTRRNIQRDVQVLRMAGVPVVRDEEFGEGGAYRIRADFFLPKANLTDQECLELSVLARIAETRSLPLLEKAAHVRDKLLQVLPAKQQEIIRDASDLFDILSLGIVDHARCSKIMTEVQRALLTKRQIEATYYTPHGKRTKRLVLTPRRAFLAGTCWYLAAQDQADQTTKLYRLPRFKSVTVTDKPIAADADWSLKEQIGNAWTVMRGDRDWYLEVEFSPAVAELVQEVRWHATQEFEPTKSGGVLFRATVSGLHEVTGWVMSYGPDAVVKKPQELIEQVTLLATRVLSNYGKAQDLRGKAGRAR